MKNILKKATVVDVRTPQEFSEYSYPGAVNIPLDQIQNRVGEIKRMNEPIVVYCRSGNRSSIAVSILKQFGFREVYNGGGVEEMLQQ